MARAFRLRPLLAAVATGALAMLGAELGLRALGIGGGLFVWPPHSTTRFRPAPGRMPGIQGDSLFAADRLGLRSNGVPEPDARCRRVLALGGSTTECLYLDQAEAWPALLEADLDGARKTTWVANAGVSGLGSRDHVAQLETLLELEAFDAVLLLTGVNDLMLRLSADAGWRPWSCDDPSARRALLPRGFTELPLELSGGAWWKRTALWRLLRRARAGSGDERVQDAAGSRYDTWRENRAKAPNLRTELPDLGPALDEFAANLRWIAARCRARDVQLILLTQPRVWSETLSDEHRALLWMGWIGTSQDDPGNEYYTAESLARGMDRYNRRLVEVASELDLELIDLSALDARESLYYDDVHFNEEGARQAARLVGARLRELGW